MLLMGDGTDARGWKTPALGPCHLASTADNEGSNEARRHVVTATAVAGDDDDGRALMVGLHLV